MAITIDTDLRHYNPVRNPVLLKASTDNYLATSETPTSFEMEFDSGDMPAAGDTIAVQSWDGSTWNTEYTITMVASGGPTPTTCNEYTSGSVNDWINTELIPCLLLNYVIGSNFSLEGTLDTLIATGYSSAAPRRRLLESGFLPISSSETAGDAPVLNANMGLLVQLWVEQTYFNSDYLLRLEDKYPVDLESAGELTVNVASVLRSYVDPHEPADDMTTAVAMNDMVRRFYIRLFEEYGDPVDQVNPATSSVRTCYLAGRSEDVRVGTPEWRTYLQPSTTGGKFLTTWPNLSWAAAKVVRAEQREFLAYIEPNIGGISTIRLMADIYYTDGTSSLNAQVESVNFGQAGRPLLFAVGIEARNLNATKTVDRMRVWLRAVGTGLDTRLTEYRYFRVDHRPHVHWRQLHYFNSWGGWDTIALSGPRSSSTQANNLVSERDTTDPTTLDDARDVQVANQVLDTVHQVGTPLLHVEELAALRDLLASERIVERVNGEHWPVQLLTDRAPTGEETTDMQNFELSYRYAFRNTANQR